MPPSLLRSTSANALQCCSSLQNIPCFLVVSTGHGRAFTTTPTLNKRKRITLQRKRMLQWFRGPGAVFRVPLKGSTNYLSAYDKEGNLVRMGAQLEEGEGGRNARREDEEDGDQRKQRDQRGEQGDNKKKNNKKDLPPETLEDLQPFPLNQYFRSSPVLSEALRNEIYERVAGKGQTVRQASQELGVEMRRVGAVVRLKRVELDWLRDNKPLAISFQTRVMSMLPQTKFDPEASRNPRHEAINDLPVHQSTLPQIFHPAPESSAFTRTDAGRIFHRGLLPADERIPHPDMIASVLDEKAGMAAAKRTQARNDRWAEEERQVTEQADKRKQIQEAHETIVKGKRWDFKIERVHADKAVGWRYGMPLEDRKKGQVKIPTRV